MKAFPSRPFNGHPQGGMALIECLISLLIFSFGVLGLVGLEARAITFSLDAEDRNRAAVFASEIASQMWINGTVSPSAGPGSAYGALLASINNVTNAGLPNGVVTVIPVAGTTNSADITITWQPPSDAATGTHQVLTTRVILP